MKKIVQLNKNNQKNNQKSKQIKKKEIGLSELKINDLSLSPEFKTNVYEYTVKYIGQATSLEIQTKATNDSYTVEIVGNTDLKEGENLITILVSDENGENVATYQVTVNKSLVDEEAIALEETRKKEEQQRMIIIGAIIAILIIGIIIFLIIRRRKNRGYAEEYTGIPFSNYDDDYNQEDYQDEDQDYEEVPRALSKNKAKRNKFFDDIPRKEENQYLSDVEDYNNSKDNNNNNDDDIASIKEKYLKNFEKNNFGTDEYEDDYEDERQLKGRHKGKRFK